MSTLTKNQIDQNPIAILLNSLRVDTVLDFDMHIMINGNLVLYRSAGLSFDEVNRRKLLENKVERLFITAENREKY